MSVAVEAFRDLFLFRDSEVDRMRDSHSSEAEYSLRVLLMDDEEMIRDVAGRMFKALGYEFETAKEGQEAISMYREALAAGRAFDVVILDWNVRCGMSGFEAATRLREINDDAIILVSSGNSGLVIDDERVSSCFSGVLHKPYTVDDIRNVMEYYRPAMISTECIKEKNNSSDI